MEAYRILKGDDNHKPAINGFFRSCLGNYSRWFFEGNLFVLTKSSSFSDMDYCGNFDFDDDLYCFETNPRREHSEGINYYFRITKENDVITTPESLLWFFNRIGILELEQVKQNPEREMEIWKMMNEAQRRLSEHYLASLNKMQSLLNSALSECCDMWKEQGPILNSEVDPEEFKLTRIFEPSEFKQTEKELTERATSFFEESEEKATYQSIRMERERSLLDLCKTYNEREYGN